jgi:hypothetical protein
MNCQPSGVEMVAAAVLGRLLVVMPCDRPTRGFVQSFDIVDESHIALDELAPGGDIVDPI